MSSKRLRRDTLLLTLAALPVTVVSQQSTRNNCAKAIDASELDPDDVLARARFGIPRGRRGAVSDLTT